MKVLPNKYLVLIIASVFFSCDAILEDDISDEEIKIIIPTNDGIYDTGVVVFNWEEVFGADYYKLQLSSDSNFMMDTILNTNYFETGLQSGSYRWSVQGFNFAYETYYTSYNRFKVQESKELTSKSLILLTPTENYISNSNDITLSWEQIPAASNYEVQIIRDVNNTRATIIIEKNITDSNYQINDNLINEDAKYVWMVKGLNETSETQFFKNAFYLDRVVPKKTKLKKPENNEVVDTTNIEFEWEDIIDEGNVKSEISFQIEISTDSDFKELILSEVMTSNSFIYQTNTISGDLYWRVRALDAANNIGVFSEIRSFSIN